MGPEAAQGLQHNCPLVVVQAGREDHSLLLHHLPLRVGGGKH